jgi:hypothetical protein
MNVKSSLIYVFTYGTQILRIYVILVSPPDVAPVRVVLKTAKAKYHYQETQSFTKALCKHTETKHRMMEGSSEAAVPETIRCSRHNDGEPFELRNERGLAESTTLVYTDLEQVLSNRMMRLMKPAPATVTMKTFRNGGNKKQQPQEQRMQQQAFFCPRRDAAFLKLPPVHSMKTMLCIPEDHQCPRVEIVCYQAEECEQQQRIRRGPHSDWKRTSFIADDRKNKNSTSARNESTKMSWIDLRKLQKENHTVGNGSFLSTEAGVIQFLRSILTPSHDASPWEAASEATATSEGITKGEIENPGLPSPEIVVLVLNFGSNSGYENDFSLLKKFRVSDAAPSWFLHGYMHLEALEESPEQVFHQNSNNRDCVDGSIMASPSASSLLIYKKLSPRRILHATNPSLLSSDPGNMDVSTEIANEMKTGETSRIHTIVEKGCLWEEYETKENDDICHDKISSSEETNNIKKNHRCRLVSPPYLNLDEEYPGANLFAKLFSKEALAIFTEDALSVPQWTPWPETAHYKVSSFGNEKPWTVFPLCHCFPAHTPENFKWLPITKSFVPRTCRLLEEALGYGDGQSYLRTALFSQLAPRSVLEEHTGWADLANHVLRLHIPLVVPRNSGINGNNDDLCGTWVDGCVETHAVGRPLLFDDSKTHRAFNYSDSDRIVLIVDLSRPDRLPLGTAESGHTSELDSFIEQMSLPK